MKNKNNPKVRKEDGDTLGENKKKDRKISDRPSPREADHESDTTPPENEIYVDMEPDELHPDEEPLDVEDTEEKDK